MSTVARWETNEYQRIASVNRRGDQLSVLFADGSCITVDPRRLLSPDAENPNWDAITYNRHEILVPTAAGQVAISWSTIRALTDKEYSAHLARAAEEQARQIGRRIKELRENRGLSGKELTERAGITPQSLSRIENGHHDVVFTTLRRILAAMGCSIQDLAPNPRQSLTHDGSSALSDCGSASTGEEESGARTVQRS